MSPPERRYRQLLAWLPEPARSRWSDEMTETYLEAATADDPEYAEFGSPSLADRWDVARLAVGLHLGAPGSSVRAIAAGRAVRLVALVGAAWLAGQALVALALTAWTHDRLPFLTAPDLPGQLSWGPLQATYVVFHLLCIGLAVCLVRGLAAARVLAGATFAVQVGLLVAHLATSLYPPTVWEWLAWAPSVVTLAAAAVVPPEPLRPRPWWLLAVPGLTLVLAWPARLPGEVDGWLVALADPVVHGALGLAATLAVLEVRARATRGPAELAVAVLAATLTLALSRQWTWDVAAGYHPTAVAATGLAAATAVCAGVIGLRAVRALPVTVPTQH